MTEFSKLLDLASERIGGRVVAANDDFFAPKENLIKAEEPVWIKDKYTDRGKWMDGWETRRRRTPGHDWCILKLGMPGVLRGVDIDTNHFIGNFPESAALDATASEPSKTGEADWKEIVPKSLLMGGSQNFFTVKDEGAWTYVRLRIFPDGGVARLRLYGIVKPDWNRLGKGGEMIDLAA